MRKYRGSVMSNMPTGLVILSLACSTSSPRPAAPAPAYQPYPQPATPGYRAPAPYPAPTPIAPRPPVAAPYPAAPYPAAPAPAAPYPAAPPVVVPPVAPLPGGADPLDGQNRLWQRGAAQQILTELVNALPATNRARVTGIPLLFGGKPGEINAFASCSKGKASMAITDGLLEVMTYLARAAAHDEIHRTEKTGEYIRFSGRSIRQGQLSSPPAGLVPVGALGGTTQLARQHALFAEQVAFVLGHELGHHYLGHLPCTGSPGLWGSAEISRVFSDKFPIFNQGSEHQADVAGTHNLLTAGSRHAGHHWTQTGALLTLRFFSNLSGGQLLSFQRSHPHPQVRIPVIVGTSRAWQATGGMSLPTLPGL